MNQATRLESTTATSAGAATPTDVRPVAQQGRGRARVIVGFALTLVGVALYCVVNLRATPSDARARDRSERWSAVTMAMMLTGAACCIAGAFGKLRELVDEEERRREQIEEQERGRWRR